MSERPAPTPETDAAVIASNGQWSFVLRETCERLERERDDAREALAASERLLDLYRANNLRNTGDWKEDAK